MRKRPGMYIGSTDENGLHHLVYEIVDNAIDEALAGYCTRVDVVLMKDGSVEVADNGRGFPVGIHPKLKRPAVEVCMTVLHAGGKFGGEGYKVSGGLHGVGASVVNALSRRLMVTVRQDGKVHQQEYTRGKVDYDLKVVGTTEETGTTVRFLPDIKAPDNPQGIFDEGAHFRFDTLRSRLREMAFLNRGIRIAIRDERGDTPDERVYHFEGGIREFVTYINRNKELLFPEPIYMEGLRQDVEVEVAMQYNDSYSENIFTYANNIHTAEGGTHMQGFTAALTRAINDYGRRYKFLKESVSNLKGEDVRESLVAVVSVKLKEPQFEGQTKTKLGNAHVRGIVDSLVSEGLNAFLEENPPIARAIMDRCLGAARAREAARKARDLTRRKTVLESAALPGKLADCSETDPLKCELFIVEGIPPAAAPRPGGTASGICPARQDPQRETRIDKALMNAEIENMITAFGCGVGEEFDLSKLRYPHCLHDGRGRGRHIRICCSPLLPLHAAADRRRLRVYRHAAAVQGEPEQAGALRVQRPAAAGCWTS